MRCATTWGNKLVEQKRCPWGSLWLGYNFPGGTWPPTLASVSPFQGPSMRKWSSAAILTHYSQQWEQGPGGWECDCWCHPPPAPQWKSARAELACLHACLGKLPGPRWTVLEPRESGRGQASATMKEKGIKNKQGKIEKGVSKIYPGKSGG